MEVQMNTQYLNDSFKKYKDNELLFEKVKAFKEHAIMGALKRGHEGNYTKLYIDFEDAVKEKIIDDAAFERIYLYLKYLSGRFLFHVGPNDDFEYVITYTFFCSLNLKRMQEALEEILDILWPEYSKYFHVCSKINDPYSHTCRTTNLIVKTINQQYTRLEEFFGSTQS